MSVFNNSSGKLLGSFLDLNMTEILYVKTYVYDNPIISTISSIFLLSISSAYMIYISERQNPVDCTANSGRFSSYGNSLWLVLISIFTVGYGDISAHTVLGRSISIVMVLFGLLITATLINLV